MTERGFYNRGARRSGGDRHTVIVTGTSNKTESTVAIQCFEGRHDECSGQDTLFGGVCACRCHTSAKGVDL